MGLFAGGASADSRGQAMDMKKGSNDFGHEALPIPGIADKHREFWAKNA